MWLLLVLMMFCCSLAVSFLFLHTSHSMHFRWSINNRVTLFYLNVPTTTRARQCIPIEIEWTKERDGVSTHIDLWSNCRRILICVFSKWRKKGEIFCYFAYLAIIVASVIYFLPLAQIIEAKSLHFFFVLKFYERFFSSLFFCDVCFSSCIENVNRDKTKIDNRNWPAKERQKTNALLYQVKNQLRLII